MGKKGKEAKRREKKQRTGRKHVSLKTHEYYDVSSGTLQRKRKSCPRCGQGTWLSEHKGRLYCGKCGYTEFEKRPASVQPGQTPAQPSPAPPEKEKPEEEKPEEKKESPEAVEAPSEEKPEEVKPEPSPEEPKSEEKKEEPE